MKKKLGIALVLLVAMVFIGCIQPTDPTDPAKVNAEEPVFESELRDVLYVLDEVGAPPLNAIASVKDGGTISYQWYSNDEANTETPTMLDGETNASYTPLTNTKGIFYYYVVATNAIDDNKDGGTKTASITSKVATVIVAVSNAESEFGFDAGSITAYKGSSNVVVIPSSIGGTAVTSISNSAFSNKNITTVFIPDTVTTIADGAFMGCASLETIRLPNDLTEFGDEVFNDCTSLESVTIPDGVTEIGRHVFRNCTSLTNVTLPDSVTIIGLQAFVRCTSLVTITMPDTIRDIHNYAFPSCTSLQSINVDTSNTTYASVDGNLYNKDETTLIIFCSGKNEESFSRIPNTVTSIGDYAVNGNNNITSVTIPDGVEKIGLYAFVGNSSLTSVIMPESIKSFSSTAFKYNDNLASVTVYASKPPTIGADSFPDHGSLVIYVPAGSVVAYQAAANWSEYSSKIQAIP